MSVGGLGEGVKSQWVALPVVSPVEMQIKIVTDLLQTLACALLGGHLSCSRVWFAARLGWQG